MFPFYSYENKYKRIYDLKTCFKHIINLYFMQRYLYTTTNFIVFDY